MDHQTQSILWGKDYELNSNHFSIIFEFCVIVYSFENIYLLICGIKCLVIVNQIFFSIITLYTKNVKQIKNTINSAPITIYVVEGKLNVKKKKKKKK